jgi:hypothetical protein
MPFIICRPVGRAPTNPGQHPDPRIKKKRANWRVFLFYLAFFIDHVLTRLGVVLLGLHLFRMQAFVLGCRIEVTGTGTGHKSDFVSHWIILPGLDALALLTQVPLWETRSRT